MNGENTDGRKDPFNSAEGEEELSVAAPLSNAWLEDLVSRRLIFVMGKGGVGKTTISVALANAASRLNKKVLLVELGDADSIGRFYDQTLAETPARLSPGIRGARVNARVEMEAYVRAHIPSKFIAGKISRSRLFDYLFEAAPGLKEVMSLGRLWRWEQEATRLPGESFDLVIVDAPATGHALSLLRLPDLLIKMIRVGPVANQLRAVQHLLKNHQKTALVLVTLPEELPVNETVELYQMAKESLDMPAAAIFINGVYPDFFNRRDTRQIFSLKTSFQNRSTAPEHLMLACAANFIRRQVSQQKHIRKIHAKSKCHVLQTPYFFTNDMTLKEIEELSLQIDRTVSNPLEKQP